MKDEKQINAINFHPFFGLRSPHLQMILSAFVPAGKSPPSAQWLVDVSNGDKLSCEVSTPPEWSYNDKTVVLIHGLGGSHLSRYMIRVARKFYHHGIKVVRVNLRGCGSGEGLAKTPYCAGNSQDVFNVVELLKTSFPDSEVFVVGFSLGGNIALKLAGELGNDADKYIKAIFAVCPPFDLERTVQSIQKPKYYLYHQYYLKNILKHTARWTNQKIRSLYEVDNVITGPSWGFKNAKEYYDQSSCKRYLNQICIPTIILSAEDDPFVSLKDLDRMGLSGDVRLYATRYGSHMGFLGSITQGRNFQWMDDLLLKWANNSFTL
jgi:predicted alpha/beta-fold hydrolase